MATSTSQPMTATTDASATEPLAPAIAGFLANFKGQTRVDAESDLSCFLRWCRLGHRAVGLRRVDLELYLRWMQNDRRYGLRAWEGRMRSGQGGAWFEPERWGR